MTEQNRELTSILLEIIKPKVVEQPPVIVNEIAQSSALFSRRRAALEERDRLAAQTLKSSTNVGRPDDSIKDLENELGVSEKEGA